MSHVPQQKVAGTHSLSCSLGFSLGTGERNGYWWEAKVRGVCVCVLVSSFYPIRACIPGGRAGDGHLIQWRMANKYFCGVYSHRNTMDGLDLDIGFAMTKHFNKISPHA